jgi:hypothetical protein
LNESGTIDGYISAMKYYLGEVIQIPMEPKIYAVWVSYKTGRSRENADATIEGTRKVKSHTNDALTREAYIAILHKSISIVESKHWLFMVLLWNC